MSLTKDQLAILKMYRPDTYSIKLSKEQAKELEAKGLIQWVPPVFPGGQDYMITNAGRAAIVFGVK